MMKDTLGNIKKHRNCHSLLIANHGSIL